MSGQKQSATGVNNWGSFDGEKSINMLIFYSVKTDKPNETIRLTELMFPRWCSHCVTNSNYCSFIFCFSAVLGRFQTGNILWLQPNWHPASGVFLWFWIGKFFCSFVDFVLFFLLLIHLLLFATLDGFRLITVFHNFELVCLFDLLFRGLRFVFWALTVCFDLFCTKLSLLLLLTMAQVAATIF